MRLLPILSLLAVSTFAQAPVVTGVRNAGIGDTSFAPLSTVYIYGTFPKGLARDFSVTVGGVPGLVTVANSTGYLTAALPSNAPLGTQPLVVSYQGANSNVVAVTLRQYAPEFETMTGVPTSDNGPQFPLASYFPFAHQNVTPVTPAAPAAPGERLVTLISGVGPTNPPIKMGTINPFEPLATTPGITVAGATATIYRAGSSSTNVEVDFMVPSNAPEAYDPVVLSIANIQSNTVNIPIATRPFISGVLNAASFRSQGTVAPGSIISIFGVGFGPTDNLLSFPQTNVNGTSVLFGGTAAPMFALATVEGQINALVPTELAPAGTVNLTIKSNLGTSVVTTLNLVPAVPGIFYFPDPTLPTRHNAAALLPNSAWIAMPLSMAAAMGIPNDCSGISTASTCAQPAHVGDVVQIFLTGLGNATPGGDPTGKPLATGSVAPAGGDPLYLTVQMPTVTIGGLPAPVQYSGIAPGFAGLYQINVQIPAGVQPGDDVAVQVSMPGSPWDTATIAVAQ